MIITELDTKTLEQKRSFQLDEYQYDDDRIKQMFMQQSGKGLYIVWDTYEILYEMNIDVLNKSIKRLKNERANQRNN